MSSVRGPGAYLRSQADRGRFSRYDRHSGTDTGAAPFVVLLAFAVFLLIAAVSCQQATREEPARNIIEASVAALTDVDLVVAENRDGLRSLAQQTDDALIPLPGYPLDVRITREAALNASDDELRAQVLDDSSSLVYQHGFAAFDRTGEQSISTFSEQGLLQQGVGQLSKTTNDRAQLAVLITAVLTALAAVALVFRSNGFARLRNAGFAALLAAVPGVLMVMAVRFFFNQLGGDDQFSTQVRDIMSNVTAVPLRNFGVLAMLGGVFVLMAFVLGWVSRNVAAFQPAAAYEGGYSDEDWDDYDYEDDWDDEEE